MSLRWRGMKTHCLMYFCINTDTFFLSEYLRALTLIESGPWAWHCYGYLSLHQYKSGKLKLVSRISVHVDNWWTATQRPGSLKLGISSKWRCPDGIVIKFIGLGKSESLKFTSKSKYSGWTQFKTLSKIFEMITFCKLDASCGSTFELRAHASKVSFENLVISSCSLKSSLWPDRNYYVSESGLWIRDDQ